MFLIAEIKIKTQNNEFFTIQLEKHYKLYWNENIIMVKYRYKFK
jgi:hypothetical protein